MSSNPVFRKLVLLDIVHYSTKVTIYHHSLGCALTPTRQHIITFLASKLQASLNQHVAAYKAKKGKDVLLCRL
jgi:hypothetical protein